MAEKTTAFTGPVVVGLNDKKGEIRLTDGKNVNEAKYLSIAAPDNITSDTTLTFPNGAGTAGQILSTDGNGGLSWVNDSAGNPAGTNGQVQTNDGGTFGAISEGTSGQILTSNGAGSAPTFQAATSGIAAVVDDTSPELGGDLASNGHDIDFADGDKAKFGNSGDLEIFHDGTNSFIKDVGTGQLKISGFDAVKITNGDDTVPSAQFISSGEAQLYYAGGQKLAANAAGITVSGKVVSDGLEVDGAAVIKLDGDFPTGVENVAMGNAALNSLTSGGQQNTAIGTSALSNITSQSGNTAVGALAGAQTTGGNFNTVVGATAFNNNVTGSNNTIVGKGAARFATNSNNTALGHEALDSQDSGFDNTAIGQSAGSTITSGSNLTVLGHNAEPSSATATNEITLGDSNVTSLRIPGLQSGASNGDVLTFNGSSLALATPSGGAATDVDVNGGRVNLRGDLSTLLVPSTANAQLMGANALGNTTSATSTVAIGTNALNGTAPGQESNDNVAIGTYAMQNYTGNFGGPPNQQGHGNTAVGTGAGDEIRGNNNVAIGLNAGTRIDGFNNTAVGFDSMFGFPALSGENNTCLGAGALTSSQSVNNEITLGNSSISTLRCNTTSISSLSDARDKKDVEDANIGLDFINDLRPVKFVWDTRDGAKKDIKEVGFIAQELDEVQQKHGVEDHLQLVLKNNPDKLEASQGKLIPILVQAIKDLKKEIDELKKA